MRPNSTRPIVFGLTLILVGAIALVLAYPIVFEHLDGRVAPFNGFSYQFRAPAGGAFEAEILVIGDGTVVVELMTAGQLAASQAYPWRYATLANGSGAHVVITFTFVTDDDYALVVSHDGAHLEREQRVSMEIRRSWVTIPVGLFAGGLCAAGAAILVRRAQVARRQKAQDERAFFSTELGKAPPVP